MVLSRGLLVSLGFTSLTSILLFFFIKQKTSSIETKINTLFNLVQEEAAKSHQRQLQQKQQNMVVSEITQQSHPQRRLIQVSDDEEESDEESLIDTDHDIESDTTTESGDSEEEEENDLGQQSGGSSDILSVIDEIKRVNIEKSLIDVKQLDMFEEDTDAKIVDTENKVIHLTKQSHESDNADSDDDDDGDDSDLGSDPEDLSVIEDDDVQQYDLKDESEDIQLNLPNVTPLDIPQATSVEKVEKVEETKEIEEVKKITPTEEVVNYKKLSVKVLKEIVASKGLHTEPAKLKKTELLKLLQQG